MLFWHRVSAILHPSHPAAPVIKYTLLMLATEAKLHENLTNVLVDRCLKNIGLLVPGDGTYVRTAIIF